MAKVIMTCGRIGTGKSTYSEQMRKKHNAVVLSVDEITLALFDQHAGEKHDEYVERLETYLFGKSLEIIECGINVILDWGFWTKEERNYAREFYKSRNVECEFHCIDVSDEEWKRRLEKRNKDVAEGKVNAYYVDENLAEKVKALFEKPGDEEIDVWIRA